jgi:CBS domain-containing protein
MEGQHREPKATEGSWRSPSIEHARVSDAMRSGVIGCPPNASIRTVAQMMATNHVHSVVLTAGDGGPVRVITDRELLAAAGPGAEDRDAASIAIDPVTVTIDELLTRAVEVMLEQGVSHLLVVNDAQRALGVVSALDVAGVLAWGRA